MKLNFYSFFLFLFSICSFSQFGIPKKLDWENANIKPIVIMQLDDDDDNAAIYNTNIKKYAEFYFGKDRIEKYLSKKEFKKFIKKNKEKYCFIGFKFNNTYKVWFTEMFFGISGKGFMVNGGYLSSFAFYNKSRGLKNIIHKFSEADIKLSLKTFKDNIDYGISHEDLSFKEIRARGSLSYSELNPNAQELKKLILLIDKNSVDDKFIETFTKNYKYSFEFVETSRIEQAILNNEEGVAFTYKFFKPTIDNKFGSNNTLVKMFYIYKASDLSNIFHYVPDRSGSEYLYKKPFSKRYAEDYVRFLESAFR
jgi:hypothetical protein